MRISAFVTVAFAVAMTIPYPFSRDEPGPFEIPPANGSVNTETASAASVAAATLAAEVPAKAAPVTVAAAAERREPAQVTVAANCLPLEDCSVDPLPPKRDLTYLADYAYSEVPPDTKPA